MSLLFDYSKSAGYFSQLAGVLAGFAFLAITLLLNRQHRRGTNADAAQEHQQDAQIVAALGCALLGLVAAGAMYALLAGEQGWALTSGRGLSRFALAARLIKEPTPTTGLALLVGPPLLWSGGGPIGVRRPGGAAFDEHQDSGVVAVELKSVHVRENLQ